MRDGAPGTCPCGNDATGRSRGVDFSGLTKKKIIRDKYLYTNYLGGAHLTCPCCARSGSGRFGSRPGRCSKCSRDSAAGRPGTSRMPAAPAGTCHLLKPCSTTLFLPSARCLSRRKACERHPYPTPCWACQIQARPNQLWEWWKRRSGI